VTSVQCIRAGMTFGEQPVIPAYLYSSTHFQYHASLLAHDEYLEED
jgi:hypothetical protein